MRHEMRRGATVLGLSFLLSGELRASPSPAPAIAPNPISSALCGRGEGFRPKLASALDIDSTILPAIWRGATAEAFQLWRMAPICPEASPQESNRYHARHRALDRLGRRLERAEAMERVGIIMARFRSGPASSTEMPSSTVCGGCVALQLSASRVSEIAARWPPGIGAKVGDRLDLAAKREPLISRLCAARPSPRAREELERQFRYYSWTASGARLLEIAAWLEQPEVSTLCQDR